MNTDTAPNTENRAARTNSSRRAPILINRNYALLWSGGAISILGDFVFSTTLVLWIATSIAKGQPWAPLAVSGVLLSTTIPIVVVGPLAGVFADRWNKRFTMMRMDGMRAVLITLLLLVSGIVPLPFFSAGRLPIFWQLGAIYGLVFLAGVCAQFFNPSSLSLVGMIVEEPLRARAAGLSQMTVSIAVILGPPLATALFFAVGVQAALILNALSFVASFLAVLFMRVPGMVKEGNEEQVHSFLREFIAGIRFYFTSRALTALLVGGIIVLLGLGALNALDIFFVTQNLHTSARLYGFLGTANGLGSITGALLAAIFAQRIGVVRTLCFALIATGVVVVIYARLTNFVPALVVLFGVGLCAAPIDVAFVPLMLHVTPPEYVGRVMSVFSPSIQAAGVLSVALAGYLDSTLLRGFHASLLGIAIGPVDTIFTACGLLTIIGGIYTAINLRGIKISNVQPQTTSADPTGTMDTIANTPAPVRASPLESEEG